jgi:hypothetical protein
MMPENMVTVKTYADGRICVPPRLLRQYAKDAGKKEVPRKIWITMPSDDKPEVITLSWEQLEESKVYDLSVRTRILFGTFPKGSEFPVILSKENILIILNEDYEAGLDALMGEDFSDDDTPSSKWESPFEIKVREHLLRTV